jgi:2-keto-4-pentenoate hydratase/2-oxohepta-3-ene-1,7-dioic acid hydratase in catechol pathway
MRLCRFRYQNAVHVGLYDEKQVVPLPAAAQAYAIGTGEDLALPPSDNLLDFLPPDGAGFAAASRLAEWIGRGPMLPRGAAIETGSVEMLVPVLRPNKIFLLAGNYAEHIEEGGGKASERAETFPYVFMKPPSTTLNDPNRPVRLPAISPSYIDWELELAVVVGRQVRGIKEADALGAVAGYTIVNDISNRRFRPNAGRKPREKDSFFDWLHGKWFDTFCPCGPCIASADAVPDPQKLQLKLRLNGELKQDASTALQIFPVAAVIEFIAGMVTLEPGDIISTGTPAGVGSASGIFLRPGDVLEGQIGSIGTLVSPVVAE